MTLAAKSSRAWWETPVVLSAQLLVESPVTPDLDAAVREHFNSAGEPADPSAIQPAEEGV